MPAAATLRLNAGRSHTPSAIHEIDPLCTHDTRTSRLTPTPPQKDTTLKHIRGQSNLTKYERKEGIASGDQMDSHFCKTCGSLLYRISSGFPGVAIMRLGAVDDFSLHEGALKPRVEQFGRDRVGWVRPTEGVRQEGGNFIKP